MLTQQGFSKSCQDLGGLCEWFGSVALLGVATPANEVLRHLMPGDAQGLRGSVPWREKAANGVMNGQISGVRLGQLIGPAFTFGSNEDSSTLYQEALEYLMAELGGEVEKALLKGYCGKGKLFVALCRTSMAGEYCDPEHPDYKTDNQVLSENSLSYMAFLG